MSDKDERKRAEEEAQRKAEDAARERREEEERRAAERAQAAQEAADAQRASASESFERRPVRPVDDSTETGRELDALQSLADEPEDRDPTVPAYSMTIPEDEIRTSVTIPENEIRFTPNAVPEPPEDPYARVLAASARMQQGAAPGGRPVNFDALDAQADEADASSAAAAQANLASSPLALPPGAPMPPPQMPPGLPPPPAATPAMAAAGGPLSAPSLPPSMAAPPPPPAPLPQQQRQADARQEAVAPQGARIPQDVRTAAMPPDEPRLAEQEPRLAATSASLPAQGVDTGEPRVSDEDEARSALRQERTMKALGYILRLAGGIGGAALYNRGGSEVAATMLARGLGGVGGALTGASPTTQQARISQARRGDDQRAQQGQEMDLRRLSQAAAERRQAMLDEQGASRLDLEGRRVAAMEEGLGLRAQQTEAQAAAARALAEERSQRGSRLGEEAQLERDLDTTDSEVSRQAQRELRTLNAQQPPDRQIPDEEIDGMTGRAARQLYAQMTRPYGNRTRETRRGDGSGGGGVAAARQILIDSGYRPEAVDVMRSRDVLAEAARVARASAPASATGTVLAGTGEDAVRSAEEVSAPAIQEFRRAWASSRSAYSAFNVLEDVQREYGARAAVSPEAIGRVAVAVVPLRAMVARVQGTGVINPGEAPLINAALPNPTDLARTLLGQQPAKLAAWREALTTDLDAQMEALGVPPEGRVRALDNIQRARVGTAEREEQDAQRGGAARPASGAATYTIRRPNGTSATTDRRDVALAAQARGLTVEGL